MATGPVLPGPILAIGSPFGAGVQQCFLYDGAVSTSALHLLFVLVLLAPVVVLAVSWFQDGLYESLRDRRFFSALVVSFSLSVLSCVFLAFLKIFAMLACFFAVFAKRPGIMAVSWMTWFVPGEALASWSAEAGFPRVSEPDE